VDLRRDRAPLVTDRVPRAASPWPERVVVTGMGAVTPLGQGADALWENLLRGVSGVRLITAFDVSQHRVRIGAPVTDFTPERLLTDRERQRLTLASQMALVAAHEALDRARLLDSEEDRQDAGVILGSAMSVVAGAEPHVKRYYETGRLSPAAIPTCMLNAPAAAISIRFGLHGQQHTIDAACAASAHAIGLAFHLIRTGLQRIVVAGGSDTTLTPGLLDSWCGLRVLSESNDDPQHACRPFNRDRAGFALGEGAGMLVLEAESSARARGARILGRVLGYGFSSDAHHLTTPSEAGQARAIEAALASAGIAAGDVDHVNAHGTATALNDVAETRAIRRVLGGHAERIPVVSVKGAIGHLLGAAGAVEAIAAIRSTMEDRVPPTCNHDDPDPECDLDYVGGGARHAKVRVALSNSFAFGGSNVCLVFGKA
jgi:beta-ketoacyl-acyl-carrier-protein synthase II